MPTNQYLLSPEEILQENQFRIRREILNKILNEVQSIKTPPEHLKKREDGFLYPEFPYMLDMMNQYFPLRKEEVEFILNDKVLVITAIATITDITTGAVRTGVDSHRMTFKKGSAKNLESVVDIGNDYKSAEQEALRNAYSRFGICADIYRRIIIKPVTKEQEKAFYTLVTEFNETITKLPAKDERRVSAEPWISTWIDSFKEHNQSTATNFIEQFKEKLTILKEKLNGN